MHSERPWAPKGGAGGAEPLSSPSPAVRCRGCAPRSCTLHTFSGTLISAAENEERALRHQVTPSRILPQGGKREPYMCPSTAALCSLGHPSSGLRAEPPFVLPSLGSPQQGRAGDCLVPTFPSKGYHCQAHRGPPSASRRAPPAGGSLPPRAHSPAS